MAEVVVHPDEALLEAAEGRQEALPPAVRLEVLPMADADLLVEGFRV